MNGPMRRKFGALARPGVGGEPLFIRLCRSFVDNLALLLRVGLVVGAVFLARDLRIVTEDLPDSSADAAAPVVEVAIEPADDVQPPPQSPIDSDRIRHYLNCTYEDYRKENFDACVDDPSAIYAQPGADDDDMSWLSDAPPLYLAASSTRESWPAN